MGWDEHRDVAGEEQVSVGTEVEALGLLQNASEVLKAFYLFFH